MPAPSLAAKKAYFAKARKRSINPVLANGVCFQKAVAVGEQFHGSSAS